MALQPLDRPAGSVHVLRYRGTIAVGAQAAATYPKANAESPSNSTIAAGLATVWVRFALFDPGAGVPITAAALALALRDTEKRFPSHVYDDGTPAGAHPSAPIASVPSATPGLNATDLQINSRTWAQNLYIDVQALDGLSVAVDTGAAQVVVDTLTSGLGLNTGLPVVIIPFTVDVTSGDDELLEFGVDVTFEIRHSVSR